MKNLYILFILAMIIALPAGSQAQELVVNGSVELWDDMNTPSDWDKAENIVQAKGSAHSGDFSAGHTSESSSKDLQQDVAGIVGGVNYTIKYYYMDNDTAAKTRIWSYWLEGTSYLDDNQEELRPDEYSVNMPGWQEFTVSLPAPANADGFRFEVRVYHENNFTGGMVYYDDFSIMAAGVSPEPTNYPTDFAAAAAGVGINLSWMDAIGDQLPNGYLVLASTEDNITAPVDGTAIADDLDLSDGSGALNVGYGAQACSFANLGTNTPYYFKIYPYTNGGADIDYKNDGTAPAANATTADISIIESENFNNGWGNWTRVNVGGSQEWEIDDIHGIDDTPCAKCSGYDGSSSNANEDWLISPSMNFDNYSSEVLIFHTADAYDGPALEALISNDYDGSDPTTASWTPLTFETSSGYFDWISSGEIDISGINGSSVFVAFKYTSTSAESATWEVDDILITGVGGTGIGEGSSFAAEVSFYPNPAVNTLNVTTAKGQTVNLQVYSLLGAQVTGDITVSGTTSIDLGGLTDGIYILHFTDEFGNSRNEKLIIE